MNGIFPRLAAALLFSTAALSSASESNQFDATCAELRYQLTAIEHQPGDKVAAFGKMIEQADALVQAHPDRPEPWLWKGVAVASQAKHSGLKGLARAKEARQLLEKSIALDPQNTGGAAYLALGTLYFKVPRWPLSFRDDTQAEALFKKAATLADHLDTHYRYGEFLLARKRYAAARKELQTALTYPARPGFPEDTLKKEDIRNFLARLDKAENAQR
ncbi:MAG: hypothetical protein EPN23_06730 [Verrucomicrobia bacterium]|nr:MAG: hypothetical protein EPN23_06730 [Verrucomicrobiota bacterium]